MKLLPFQQENVETAKRIALSGGLLLADEMGLGKTIQGLAITLGQNRFPLLIVCPATLKLNWEREIKRWFPQMSVSVLSGTKPRISLLANQVLIANYDILEYWLPLFPTFSAVIFDESHYVKNGSAARTKACIRLSDKLPPTALRICLSGTPITNNPTELVTQLRILKRIDDFGGVAAFRKRYSNNDYLNELNEKLLASCMIRRTKAEVLKELPDKRWATILLPSEPTAMKEYRKAENDFVNYLLSLCDDDEELLERLPKLLSAEQLVKINHLKVLAAQAKMLAAVEWIESFPTDEKKVVLFAHHRSIVKGLAQRFAGGCMVIGGQTSEQKQEAIEKFQNDPKQRVIVCSLKAAGVGITLTAASDVVFLEQGWTAADMDQAADRCHRIGQQSSVTAWNLICADTIEERIERLIQMKREIASAAIDGKPSAAYESVTSELLQELIQRR